MKEKEYLKQYIVAIAVIFLTFGTILLDMSGLVSADPKVEAVPDNCYSDTLFVLTDSDYSPYSFFDADGNPSGYEIELITLIANRLHMNLELVPLEWQQAIRTMNEGKFDVLLTCDYSDSFDGVEKLVKSNPTSNDFFAVYSKHKVSSLNAMFGKRIAIMENGNVTPQMELLGFLPNCTNYRDNRQAMESLIKGQTDFAVMRQTVGANLLEELDASGIKAYLSAGQSYMCFGIRNAEIAEKINGVIVELKQNGQYDELCEKWLTTFVKPYTLSEVVIHNPWIVILFVMILAAGIFLFIYQKQKEADAKTELLKAASRDAAVIANLSDDFGCVIYLDIATEHEIHYRYDPLLSENIEGWDRINVFHERVRVLGETLVHPEDRQAFKANMTKEASRDIVRREGKFLYNFRILTDSGTIYYQAKIVPDRNNAEYAIAGFRNIDSIIRREIENKEKLEAANRSKSDFLFNMSHDIRTPMNAIMGFTNMAQKNIGDTQRLQDCLSKIEMSGSHLLELINEVLDMSRIEAGKLRSEMKTVNVLDEARSLMEICMETAQQRGITLSFRSDDIAHPVVLADELHVNQIVMNIMGNAIKYTNPGGSVVYSIRETESDAQDCRRYIFTVSDNGIGMSKEYLNHIYDSFSREENAMTSAIQGTGLGMAIVKRLVDYLGGTIEIESEQGKGTTVVVSMSFKPVLENVPDNRSPLVQSTVSLEGRRILLVEDNELNREIALAILEDKGAIVEYAVDGNDAVEHVAKNSADYYDAVLMDLQMPHMNGYDATREIRKIPGMAKLPIIALSANAFEEDRKMSADSGMNDHVSKPIDVDELMRTLSKYF